MNGRRLPGSVAPAHAASFRTDALPGLPDRFLPPSLAFNLETAAETGRTVWSPGDLASLVAHLSTRGSEALAGLGDDELLGAWATTVERFRDPAGPERLALEEVLVRTTALSPRGLVAALETILAGVAHEPAARLFARARRLDRPLPALVVLAGNLPALGLQPLLPALALRRPLLLKSSSAEPYFLPAFVGALSRRLPGLGDAVAVAAWRGGDVRLEAPLLAAVGRILAYGDAPALDDLARRAPGRVLGHGPKASVALVGDDADLGAASTGLARDIALFDQRGCLSVHAVYTTAPAEELAAHLADQLTQVAVELPPGDAPLEIRAAVRQLREVAALQGRFVGGRDLADGTVVVEPDPAFSASPGLRTVRVHPVLDLEEAIVALVHWKGRLQGAALAGTSAWERRTDLELLGISRFAPPGALQSADASWANGGIDPLDALT